MLRWRASQQRDCLRDHITFWFLTWIFTTGCSGEIVFFCTYIYITAQVLNAMRARARARAGHFQCRRGRGGKILKKHKIFLKTLYSLFYYYFYLLLLCIAYRTFNYPYFDYFISKTSKMLMIIGKWLCNIPLQVLIIFD